MTTTKETLIQAKAILKEKGWARTDLISPRNGCVCILGAVGLAAGVPEEELRAGRYESFIRGGPATLAVDALISELPDEFHDYDGYDDYSSVYNFNDHQSTVDTVFALIDRAIEAAA